MTGVIFGLLFVPRLRPVHFLPVRIIIGIAAWFLLMFLMAVAARGDYPYFL